MKKRVLALILSLAVALPLMPLSAFAKTPETPITEVNVVGYETPVIEQSIAGHLYGLSVPEDAPYTIAEAGWYDASYTEAPLNDFVLFESNDELFLSIKLTPKAGYCFDDDSYPGAKINGSDELVALESGYYIDLDGNFYFQTVKVTPVEGETVTVYGITVNGFEHPVVGQTVAENLALISVPDNADYFIRDAYWSRGDETQALDDSYVFDAEESYRLTMVFRLKGKAQFDDEVFSLNAEGITVDESEFYGGGYYFRTVKVSPIHAGEPIPVPRVEVINVQLPVIGQSVANNLASLTVPENAHYFIDSENTWWASGGEKKPADFTFKEGDIYVLHVNVNFEDGYGYDVTNGEVPFLIDSSGEFVEVDSFLWQQTVKTVYVPSVSLTPAPAVWGDANGDGAVNNKDIVRLKNYLANLDEGTGVSQNGSTVYTLAPGADANGDGPISNKDIVRLKNYLANYNEKTKVSSNGTATYILGPET